MLVNAGKTLFLGESVKVFLKEISTLIGELKQVFSPPQGGWAASTLSRAQRGQTGGGRTNPSSLSFSCPPTLAILILGPCDLDLIMPIDFLFIQLANSRL